MGKVRFIVVLMIATRSHESYELCLRAGQSAHLSLHFIPFHHGESGATIQRVRVLLTAY